MKYWLIKSEPNCYSWSDMKKDVTTTWDGVRNYQARNNMKEMSVGDLCLFYHSNIGKEIVGIVQVISPFTSDISDASGKFGMVKVKYKKDFKKNIKLSEIKLHPKLQNIPLIKQSRLSVMPISKEEWDLIVCFGEG